MNKKIFFASTALAAILVLFQHFTSVTKAPECDDRFVDSLIGSDQSGKAIKCSLKLNPKDVVRTPLVLKGTAASNVTIDCNGALLDPPEGKDAIIISSDRLADGTWARPENIVVKNCNIHGSIRVYGMNTNGEGDYIRESSRKDDQHTKRAQDAAPKNILFDHLKIEASGRIPYYLSPGVTFVTLQNSHVTGATTSTAVYFDAESARNTLRNNVIDTDTDNRELIALDGSAHNLIVGNKFSSLNHGGIYLYRNCGEGGTVRHQTPSYNIIISNFFYYNKYDGGNAAVHVASRNGMRPYCFLDRGFPWGSSVDNNDLARHNVIADNQFAKLSPDDMIEMDESPNLTLNNRTVDSYQPQKYSCYDRASAQFLLHGQSFIMEKRTETTCLKKQMTCNHGVLEAGVATACVPTQVVKFDCQVTGTNDACRKQIACPAGHKINRSRAACNLEYGTVSERSLNSQPWNTLTVITPSDNREDGKCSIDTTEIDAGRSLINLSGKKSVMIACSERDSNGGDCHITAQLECIKVP
jgi:parallel beta-helix repeat protein